MAVHLSSFAGYMFPFGNVIAPLVIWLTKRKETSYVDEHGKEVVNFQISLTIYLLIAIAFSFILIGIPALLGLVIFSFVVTIQGAIKANDGKKYRYPLCIRFIK